MVNCLVNCFVYAEKNMRPIYMLNCLDMSMVSFLLILEYFDTLSGTHLC
jgi:hypothetical protein